MLSRLFLMKQGKCCGHGCLMCPYTNKHSGESTLIRKNIWNELNKSEKIEFELFLKKEANK